MIVLAWFVAMATVGCDQRLDRLMGEQVQETRHNGLQFTVRQGRITDQHGRLVVLRGVNLSGTWKRGPEHLGVHTEADIARLAEFGFTVVRMLTFWSAIMPERGVIDTLYLEKLEQRVRWCWKHGIFVVLDMHQDVYGPGFGFNGAPLWTCEQAQYDKLSEPAVPWFAAYLNDGVIACYDQFWNSEALQEYYRQAWVAVLSQLRRYPNLVGADLMNEPYWGSHDLVRFESERLWPMVLRLIAALREVRADLLIFVEPAAIKNVLGKSFLPGATLSNLVYAPHLYHPSMEVGGAFAGLADYFAQRLETDASEARNLNAALFLGEWGSYGTQSDYVDFLKTMLALSNERLFGWTYWESGPAATYGLFGPQMKLKEWGAALMGPYPHLLAGRDPQFSESEGRFVLTYQSLANTDLETVIVYPRHLARGLELIERTNIRDVREEDGRVVLNHVAGDVATRVVFRLRPL